MRQGIAPRPIAPPADCDRSPAACSRSQAARGPPGRLRTQQPGHWSPQLPRGGAGGASAAMVATKHEASSTFLVACDKAQVGTIGGQAGRAARAGGRARGAGSSAPGRSPRRWGLGGRRRRPGAASPSTLPPNLRCNAGAASPAFEAAWNAG